jgi:hypothetical protein
MKRVLAVTFLLMSFASVALADGSGLPPIGHAVKSAAVEVADGGGLPPTGLLDGGGLPPTGICL